ncbi:MAG: MFS transporter [Candidatus Methylacidiphilales bacterium]|nr:MFS transporter [Candidatus Methylacidiphilales bacterium]
MMILETQHKRIPWRWVVLLAFVGQAHLFVMAASGSMTFTMRKFIESPVLINGISSLDVLFNVLVAAPCLYYSDRIWTRYGRRLPFVLTAWSVMAVVMFLLPLAGHAVPVGILVVLWLIFCDVGSTFQTLQMEIIPPEQRGRASAISGWFGNIGNMLFLVIISGRFDDAIHLGSFKLDGEQLIYWFAACCACFCVVFSMLFIRERPPLDVAREADQHSGRLVGALRELFAERSLWPVYLLAFSTILMGTGLGSLGDLLVTEQWGYSKQEMGTNILFGGIINMVVVIPFIGLIVDRFPKLRLVMIGVVCFFLVRLAYYFFVQYVLPDHRPTIGHMIFFGQLMSICGVTTTIALQPLIFEYIPRGRMGTAQAGLNFVRSITRLVTLNGVGLWVALYSQWFLPQGQYDYFSGTLFLLLLDAASFGFLLYFAHLVRLGRIQPVGLEGYSERDVKIP